MLIRNLMRKLREFPYHAVIKMYTKNYVFIFTIAVYLRPSPEYSNLDIENSFGDIFVGGCVILKYGAGRRCLVIQFAHLFVVSFISQHGERWK